LKDFKTFRIEVTWFSVRPFTGTHGLVGVVDVVVVVVLTTAGVVEGVVVTDEVLEELELDEELEELLEEPVLPLPALVASIQVPLGVTAMATVVAGVRVRVDAAAQV